VFLDVGEMGDDAIAGRKSVFVEQFFIVAENLGRNRKYELGQGFAIERKCLLIGNGNHMEHYVVVCSVLLVLMSKPIRSTFVNFNISHPQLPAYFHFCVKEIGPSVEVMETGIYDVNFGAVFRVQRSERVDSVLPNVMEQFFHICVHTGLNEQR